MKSNENGYYKVTCVIYNILVMYAEKSLTSRKNLA